MQPVNRKVLSRANNERSYQDGGMLDKYYDIAKNKIKQYTPESVKDAYKQTKEVAGKSFNTFGNAAGQAMNHPLYQYGTAPGLVGQAGKYPGVMKKAYQYGTVPGLAQQGAKWLGKQF